MGINQQYVDKMLINYPLNQCENGEDLRDLNYYNAVNIDKSESLPKSKRIVYDKDTDGLDGNPSGVHPNEIGHKLIASHFLVLLEKLLMQIL